MDTPPSFLLAKYDNVELIGSGGFGRVYKCTRAEITTAVKILVTLDSESQARFQREVDILRRVDHENIVKILDTDKTEEYHWYESAYASLGHFGEGYCYPYNDEERVNYFRQICLGVQTLHDFNPPIIHRDLKPRNILVFEDSEREIVLKIADFGLAAIVDESSRLTRTGAALGTDYYMAPEPKKTTRSDIYSLGITFLEAYAGRPIPSPENLALVPDLLKPIIEKMIRQRYWERYQSIAEVLEAFNSLPSWQLFTGREPRENEGITHIYQIEIGRELENALDSLDKADSTNVFERLDLLERTLDRLGDARGHEALTLMNIPRSAIALIDKANQETLRRLVQRFDDAAQNTPDQDFFSPQPQSWSRFLADTFRISSYRPTKHLCLECLVKFLDRFGTPGAKHHLYQTIEGIEDPSYMEHLAVCLREVGREDIASLLDGVPEQRVLDLDALRIALGGSAS